MAAKGGGLKTGRVDKGGAAANLANPKEVLLRPLSLDAAPLANMFARTVPTHCW
jgi:hypothetical protein